MSSAPTENSDLLSIYQVLHGEEHKGDINQYSQRDGIKVLKYGWGGFKFWKSGGGIKRVA